MVLGIGRGSNRGTPLVVLMVQAAKRTQSRVLTPRPEGLHLVGAVLWEGVVYGIDEGLLLSVLPVLMTWQALSALGVAKVGLV